MVYDRVHHQTVLFGGQSSGGTALAETWLFDGTTWTHPNPTAPPARLWASMAFDPATGNVVLFGGCTTNACTSYLHDTWAWNGTTWTNITGPVTNPTGRKGAAMAFFPDEAYPGVILYGGADATGPLSDTWVLDSSNTWSSVPLTGPPGLSFASMSLDPINHNLVLFGGHTAAADTNDTWLFTGGAWVHPNVASPPPIRSTQGSVFDSVCQKVLIFGGLSGSTRLNDTWLWDGTFWTPEIDTTLPSARSYVNLSFDTRLAVPVLFGGITASGDATDTWTLNYTYNSGWMSVDGHQTGMNPARANQAIANDGSEIYLFGGVDGSNTLYNDTHVWTSGVEAGIFTSASPPTPARKSAAMVYSPDDNGVLMFGGGSGTGGLTPLNDTWLFTSDWSPVTIAVPPPTRYGHNMVYDPINHRVVMFGGNHGGTLLNDTWSWHSGSWSFIDSPHFPAARQDAAMVYDAARLQIVLFGGAGLTSGSQMQDTWVFDGNDWTQLTPATVPPARSGAQMVYDSTHGTVLMFGGSAAGGLLSDMWRWDGVNWTSVSQPFITPPGTSGASVTYARNIQQFYMFGGYTDSGIVNDTWLWNSPYTSTLLTTGFSGQPYSENLSILGGNGSYTVTGLGFPWPFSTAGLTLTGLILHGNDSQGSGPIPLGIGVSVADGQGQIAYFPYTLYTDSLINFAPNPPQYATVGGPFSYQLSATGGTPPYQYHLDSTFGGLSVNNLGLITASCSSVSTGTYSITVSDTIFGTVTAGPFTLNCNPAPLITNSATLAGGQVNASYNVQLTTNAVYGVPAPGAAPYTWSANPALLPPGLSLNSSTGVISGFPTAAGPYTFTVTFTDAWSTQTSKQFTITVIPQLLISTTQLPTGTRFFGYPSGTSIVGTGGVPGYTYSATSLPPGLLIDAVTGALTGTPTTSGNYNPFFTVTDSTANHVTQVIPINVVSAGTNPRDWIQLSPASAPSIRQNAASFYDSVNGQLIVFSGDGPTVTNDTLSWNGTNWTPLNPNHKPTQRKGAVAAFDPVHQQGVMFGGEDTFFNDSNETWLWYTNDWHHVTTTHTPTGRAYAAMAWDGHHIVMFGGSVEDGQLGDTWYWDGNDNDWHSVTPTPTPLPRYASAMAFDSAHNQVVMFGGYDFDSVYNDFADTWIWDGGALTWTHVLPAASPTAREGFSLVFDPLRGQVVLFGGYSQASFSDLHDTWEYTGGVTNTWAPITTFHNPVDRDSYSAAWDTVRNTLVLFGGTSPLTSEFYENDTWILDGPFVNSGTMPTAAVGTPYNYTPPEFGGIGPLTFTATSAPPWSVLSTITGTYTGTPNAPSVASINYVVIDSQGVSSTAALSLTTTSSINLQPTTLPNATAGANYLVQLSATGGLPNYVFSATGLPAGLSLNASNQIVGQCTASSSTVMLSVTDAVPETANVGPLTVTCNASPAVTTTSPLTSGIVNSPYMATFQMSGGTGPFTWTLGANTLPGGFNLSPAGVLTGSTTTPVTATLNVTVSDFWNAQGTKQFQLTILSAITVTSPQLAIGNLNIAYPAGQAIVASGGAGGYHYTATGMPPGLTVNLNTGAITGTPTAVGTGTYNPTFTVTDQLSNSILQAIPIYVAVAGTYTEDWIQLTPATVPTGRANASMFYDSIRHKTIMFGGALPGDPLVLGDTESWDGANWTLVSSTGPSARAYAAVAFDPVNGQGVLFGGQDANGQPLGETWLWNGTTWLPTTPGNSPLPRTLATMSWDGHHIILFGGSNNTIDLNETWSWDGHTWTNVTPATSPAIQENGAMAYDSVHDKVVLFGGLNSQTATDSAITWIWDGVQLTWTNFSPVPSPVHRHLHAMAFDALRGQVVVFGGVSQGTPSTFLQDTWMWDGTNHTWKQITTAHSPLPRTARAMSYDPVSQQVVLFGGNAPLSVPPLVSDTWVLDGPYVGNTALINGTVNVPYSASVPVQALNTPLTYVQPTLPPGFTFNTSTGTFGGTPTAAGPYSIPVTIQDSQGISIIPQLAVIVDNALTLQQNSLPNATSGANYNVQLSAIGGLQPYTFQVTGAPAGLSLNASNQIVGQCTASSSNVMLKVTDNTTPTANVAQVGPLSVTCNPAPSITTTSLPNNIVNTPYSTTVQATGGTAPLNFTISQGSLPSGFNLTGNQITGSATSPSSTTFSVTATDFWNATSTVQFTLQIESGLTITSTTLPPGTKGSAYPNGITLGVSGGTGAGTYTFSATGLPNGLQIDPASGAITGIPTQSGTFQPTFTVVDQTPQTVHQQVAIQILANTGNLNWTNLNPAGPPSARDSYAMAYDPLHAVTVLYGGNAGVGDTWTFQFPSTWTQLTAAPPPQQAGAAMAWVAPKNNMVLFGGLVGASAVSTTWTWDGSQWAPAATSTTPPARAYQGMAPDSAHNQVVMFGGSTTAGYQQALNDTYVWDGTNWTHKTTTAMTATFAPSLADGPTGPVLFGGEDTSGNPLNQTYVWDGSDWHLQHPLISPPARGVAGMVYNSQSGVTILFGGLSAGGQLQDAWQWDGLNWTQLNPAAAPPTRTFIGLSYDSAYNQTIVFGGESINAVPTPELADTWTLGGPVVVSTTLPGDSAGAVYTAAIPVIGGTPPYSFAQTGNPQSLPTGLQLNASTGQITGATQSVGAYSVGIAVTDSQTVAVTPTFSLSVSAASAVVLSPATLPDATAGTPYNVQLSAVGGVPPYTFNSTTLPAGLQINASNQIAGQCTAGASNVSYSVTDSALPTPNSASIVGLTVNCNALPTLTTASPLTTGVVGVPYTASLQKSGGTAPISWTLSNSTLPAGFQLSSTGVLTGTANAPVVAATFDVTVKDFWNATGVKTYTLTIYPVLTITNTTLPNGTAGVAYQGGVTIAPSGGTGNGTYAFSATGLPTGFSIDPSTGTISGNTSQTGLFTPSFKVTDQDAQTATKQINLTILNGSGITILSPTALPVGTAGQPYTYQLQWVGGVTPSTIASSALPGWLNLNASTGNLTGTPPAGGVFTFPITVTDSQTPTANTATQTETIIVSPPSVTSASPLPAATIGIAYTQNLTAGGGTGPYAWTSSNLPAWLSLSGGGALTGTPPLNTPASVSFDVKVTDSLGAYSSGSLTLPVLATPGLYFQTVSPLPPGTPSVAYGTTIQVGGGNGVFTLSAASLPNWLSFNTTTGALTGTPPAAGPVTFKITLSDNVNQTLSQYFTLPVNGPLTLNSANPLLPATVGLAYSGSLAASGGSGGYTWSASGLPQWLAINAAGVMSGIPTLPTTATFRVTVKDSQNHSVSETFNMPVIGPLTVTTVSPLSPATLNYPYLATFAAAGGAGSYHWSAAGLPNGFTLSPSGLLLGTAAAAAPINFSVTVTDAVNATAVANITLPVSSAVTVNTSSPLLPATALIPYSANFSGSGGNPGYSWTAAGLPAWLTLTQGGYLSGTPPAAGPVSFQATITDSQNQSVTAGITLPVNASLSITTGSLPPASANLAYSTPLAAAGGIGTYTWSGTNLPQGLTMSAAGVLSGTLTKTGTYPVQVTVWDTQTSVASQSYTLLVSTGSPLTFVTQNLNPCVPNAACSNQIVAGGGTPPYTFSLAANANLNGLSLSANGLLSGIPASGGPISVPVILSDLQTSISKTFTQPVIATLLVTTGNLSAGTVGSVYGAALAAAGGQPPYTWSLVNGAGSLPPGLNLDAQGGNIFGTPTAAGNYTFSVQVADGQQTSPGRQLSISIAAIATTPVSISSPAQLAAGTVATGYSQNLTAAGGSGQYTWSVTAGSLPAGLGLAVNGAITGTPTTAQNYIFTATVKDASGTSSASAGFTIIVAGPETVALITPNPLPNGAVGVVYSYPIQVLGGTPPYFYSISAGQVPPGLIFDPANGTLSGTPTQKGSFGVQLTVTDSGGAPVGAQRGSPNAKQTVQANVTTNYIIGISGAGDFQITTPQNLPSGTLGAGYSTAFAASGGTAPYQWQLVFGSLPTGLNLSAGGLLTGTPTQSGLASLVVKVTDFKGAVSTGAFLLQIVNPNVPAINSFPLLPTGTVGQVYTAAFTGVGGHAPYVWSITGGSLPPGVSLDQKAGTLSGTPSKAGNFPFTVSLVDSKQVTATQVFAIRVNAETLQITPAQIPPGTANVPYSAALAVAGGTAPYSWSLSAGGLLNGFAIDPATGKITGTPPNAGSFTFTISVIDSNFGMDLQSYQFTVQSSTIGIDTVSVPATTVGATYDYGLVAENAVPPLTWLVASGTLPPGIQLVDTSGLLVGTPTSAGSYTFTVKVTDYTAATAQATFTLVVNALPLTVVTTTLPGGAVATAYSQTVQSSGGTGAITWSVTAGALPTGLSLDSTKGTIFGTPTAPGSFSFTLQATDSKGVTAQQHFTVSIAGPPAVPAITLSGLPATSKPGDQPTVTITLASPYALPLTVTATLSITPNLGNSTDLAFANGSRTTQITIPANTTTATLKFQTGTLPGTIQFSLSLSAAGVNVTPTAPPTATTAIAGTAPTISSVVVTTTTSGIQVKVVGTSTTLDMKNATFTFTPAGGASLTTASVSVDVSAMFTAWYQSAASLATGSQFSLTMPFTITGNVSSIASVSVVLTNSVGASPAASANVP